jgi:predicted peroxiredoxin
MATMIVNATHGPEDPERATLAFITGNVAATADQDAIVLLTIEGAWLGVRGRPDNVAHPGMPTLPDVMGQFVANGGRIWACGACTKPRGITQDDLVEGATIVTAAQVVELLASGAASLTF